MRIPLVVDSLDDEPQRGADGVHILAHNLLDDGRLARIIEPSTQLVSLSCTDSDLCARSVHPHSIRILNSLSLSRALRRIDNIFLLRTCALRCVKR